MERGEPGQGRGHGADPAMSAAPQLPAGSQLLVAAADWPVEDDDAGQKRRTVGRLAAEDLRPVLQGTLEALGTAADASEYPGSLLLDGLWIDGRIGVLEGNLGKLRLAHCTLAPDEGGITVAGENSRLELAVVRTVSGPIVLSTSGQVLEIDESIVASARDGTDSSKAAIAAPLGAVSVDTTTVFGTTTALTLNASDSLFTGAVQAIRRQTGCVRFSHLPKGSDTARRYQCQPDLALEQRAQEQGLTALDELEAADEQEIRDRLTPAFTSVLHGDPGFAQLALRTADEIRKGAEDGSEMGAFGLLKQPQREANLNAALQEYLRVGLEAGAFFAT
jgi:hypothetical protein